MSHLIKQARTQTRELCQVRNFQNKDARYYLSSKQRLPDVDRRASSFHGVGHGSVGQLQAEIVQIARGARRVVADFVGLKRDEETDESTSRETDETRHTQRFSDARNPR